MVEFYEDRPFFRELQNQKDIVGVEIGVMGGRNAEDILVHLDIKKLWLIDPWRNYEYLQGHGMINEDDIAEECYQATVKRMEPFMDKVGIFKTWSKYAAHEFLDESLDFVYIDGNHRYTFVLEDILHYTPKVKTGGWIAGHDFKVGEQGVMKAVLEAFGDRFTVKPPAWDWWHKKEETDEKTLARFIDR